MKIAAEVKTNPLQEIAESGARPITKEEPKAAGTDARATATTLAADIMSLAMQGNGQWKRLACRIIVGTTDMRVALLAALEQHMKAAREQVALAVARNVDKDGKPDLLKSEGKSVSQQMNSAYVNVSHMRKITRAFNAGGTVDGLLDYCRTERPRSTYSTLDDVTYELMRGYADLFKDGQASRTPDPWLTKLSKWVEKNPAPEGDEKAAAAVKAITALIADLSK